MKSTRDAYGEALVELGTENPYIVVLDADCSESTRTSLFGKKFPDRFFNVGVAEQNLVDVAAGLALCGAVPFVSTFAIFACRAWEQIRNTIACDNLNVKIVVTHSGLSGGPDGVSHQSLEDIAIMRSIPGLSIFVPCDATSTKFIVKTLSYLTKPSYVRLGREKMPSVYEHQTLDLLKAEVLHEGNDVSIIACGTMVHEAIEAANFLNPRVKARVIDMHVIKPLDTDTVLRAAYETGAIVTAEEHSIIGGLGGAVAEVLGSHKPVPLYRVGTNDTFCESGTPRKLMEKYGLTAKHIVCAVDNVIKLKREI